MKKNKGFTLIELLVVIAIIGILASVVLASLSSARSKGADAATQSQLVNMRAQAELYSNTQASPTYAGACAATAANNGLAGLIAGAVSSSGATATVTALATVGAGTTVTCHDSAAAWAAEAPMKASTVAVPSMYCVDSTGKAKAEAAVLAANAVVCA